MLKVPVFTCTVVLFAFTYILLRNVLPSTVRGYCLICPQAEEVPWRLLGAVAISIFEGLAKPCKVSVSEREIEFVRGLEAIERLNHLVRDRGYQTAR